MSDMSLQVGLCSIGEGIAKLKISIINQ
jgi:hypothetical protein